MCAMRPFFFWFYQSCHGCAASVLAKSTHSVAHHKMFARNAGRIRGGFNRASKKTREQIIRLALLAKEPTDAHVSTVRLRLWSKTSPVVAKCVEEHINSEKIECDALEVAFKDFLPEIDSSIGECVEKFPAKDCGGLCEGVDKYYDACELDEAEERLIGKATDLRRKEQELLRRELELSRREKTRGGHRSALSGSSAYSTSSFGVELSRRRRVSHLVVVGLGCPCWDRSAHDTSVHTKGPD
jgi:hypothetical protein